VNRNELENRFVVVVTQISEIRGEITSVKKNLLRLTNKLEDLLNEQELLTSKLQKLPVE
jgi:hypothetical protein